MAATPEQIADGQSYALIAGTALQALERLAPVALADNPKALKQVVALLNRAHFALAQASDIADKATPDMLTPTFRGYAVKD
jgi:hypothetical protein